MWRREAGPPWLCLSLFWLWLSHASHLGTLVPPDQGQFTASSTEWREAEINLEGKLFCLSGQIKGNCLIDCVALISFYELPGAQSSLSNPPSELAGSQQDLCWLELKDLLAFASCLPLGKSPREQNHEQGVLVCAAGSSPQEARQQLLPECCTATGPGSCFSFWSLKALCAPQQMGGHDAHVS